MLVLARLKCSSLRFRAYTIVRQDKYDYVSNFRASNGIWISSIEYPDYQPSYRSLNIRGSDKESDCIVILVPLEHVEDVEAAIKEFNSREVDTENVGDAVANVPVDAMIQ